MLIIPTIAVPAQIARVGLPTQQVTISLYQRRTGLYIDVSVNDALIIAGVLCLGRVRIIRDVYLGFDGDLGFIDTQSIANPIASADPDYTGLGGRFLLAWLAPADLTAASP